ncbi:MAG: gliding motility protein GldC [Saprospiraceae bacterium]|nr:gliding motility protein GldC [Saprospiraceae bacterium]
MSKTTEIKLIVNLDEQNIPESIFWSTDNHQDKGANAKAFLLSIFEEESKDTLKLDLWTKDFQMEEMNRFMFHSLQAMCDTYVKATNNKDLANQFMNFVNYFGEKTEIITPTE